MGKKKKLFWLIFVILFIVIVTFIGNMVYNSIFEAKVRAVLKNEGIDTSDLTLADLKELITPVKADIEITDDTFVCRNDIGIQSRAFIIVLGFGNHDKDTFFEENGFIQSDPGTKGLLTYVYDETLTLDEISDLFVVDANDFLKYLPIGELIIVGASAGGNIAINSVANLDFNGPIELHTMASPLNGYDLNGIRARFISNRSGFEREIAVGFGPLSVPSNVKVYHHKTVKDSSLVSWCGNRADLCDSLQIQNNNVPGSNEFYYEENDHGSIMHDVLRNIIRCHSQIII